MADLNDAFRLFNHSNIKRIPIDDPSIYHNSRNHNPIDDRHIVDNVPIEDIKIDFNYGNKEEFQNIVDNFNNIMMNNVSGTNCYSPCSIMYIMLIVYLGCTDKTKEQIKKVLNITSNDDVLYESLIKTQKILQPSNSVNMDLSNGMFVNSKLISDVKEEYKQLFSKIGIISGEDFSNSTSVVSKINGWVSNKTNGLIRNLLNPSSISLSTLMVLVNTLYFKSKWMYGFNKSLTYDNNFRTSTDQIKTVPLMNVKNNFLYYENDDIQLIEIPYKNTNYVMRILLPRYNVRKVRSSITELSHMLHTEKVILFLPRFKLDLKMNLVGLFKGIRMELLFDSEMASLKKILKNEQLPNLYVDDIIHQAFIIVDEEGTDAVAATPICMMLNCGAINKIEKEYIFRVDHTFQYQIFHKPTQTILFNGVYDG